MTFFFCRSVYMCCLHMHIIFYFLLLSIGERRKRIYIGIRLFFFHHYSYFPRFCKWNMIFFFFRGSHAYLVESHSNRCTMMLHCNNTKKRVLFFLGLYRIVFFFLLFYNYQFCNRGGAYTTTFFFFPPHRFFLSLALFFVRTNFHFIFFVFFQQPGMMHGSPQERLPY